MKAMAPLLLFIFVANCLHVSEGDRVSDFVPGDGCGIKSPILGKNIESFSCDNQKMDHQCQIISYPQGMELDI